MFNEPSRLGRRLKLAAGLSATLASLAFVGAANAAVTVVTPDEGIDVSCPASATSSNLTTAITGASSGDVLVLEPGTYCPVTPNSTPITTPTNLTIVADHAYQSTGGLPEILVSAIDATADGVLTVNSGSTLNLEGFNFEGYPGFGDYVVDNSGTVNTWGVDFAGNSEPSIGTEAGATTNMYDSEVAASLGSGLFNAGTLNLYDTDLTNNNQSAIQLSGGITNAYNTLIAKNVKKKACAGGTLTVGIATLTDDTSCGTAVQYPNKTGIDSFVGVSAPTGTGQDNTEGGPTDSTLVDPNNLTTLKGNSQYCMTTDQRFFVNPVSNGAISCDIGSVTYSATQETTAPSCTATFTNPGVEQQVTLSDPGSGIGPQFDPDTDNPSNTPASTYPPSSTPVNVDGVPQVPGAVPGDAVSNLYASNTSVTVNGQPAAFPTTGNVILDALKGATPGVDNSQWSFTGINWAGVSAACY